MIKPGYRTSEFWFTLVSFIFSGLYLLGLIGENSQKEDLIQETSKGLEAVILIVGQLVVLYKYVKGRSDLKKIWWSGTFSNTETVITPEPEIVLPKPQPKPKTRNKKPKGKSNVKQRKNQNWSR